jgi:hypothetical protein
MAMTVKNGDDRRTLLEEEIQKRIHFYESPPEDFDPLTAEPDVLAKHGIPPRPNAEDLPVQARFWTEMFSPPLVFTERKFLFLDDPILISAQLRVTASGRRESSLNWSGAYITPRNGRQFTEVHGRWEVPAVAVSTGTSGNPEFRSSIWIGLDGQRRYLDSSLPQVGTAQFLNAPNDPPFSVWWQWWLRNNPATFSPVTIALPILAHQHIMASLLVLDETHVHFLIENRTTGQIFPPFTMASPTDTASQIQAKVSGASAEWVVERPMNATTGDLYELPNYDAVHFTDCFAISANMPPAQQPGPGLEQTLDGARLIKMYKVERNPSRTVTISKTKRPDVDRLETIYTG